MTANDETQHRTDQCFYVVHSESIDMIPEPTSQPCFRYRQEHPCEAFEGTPVHAFVEAATAQLLVKALGMFQETQQALSDLVDVADEVKSRGLSLYDKYYDTDDEFTAENFVGHGNITVKKTYWAASKAARELLAKQKSEGI